MPHAEDLRGALKSSKALHFIMNLKYSIYCKHTKNSKAELSNSALKDFELICSLKNHFGNILTDKIKRYSCFLPLFLI